MIKTLISLGIMGSLIGILMIHQEPIFIILWVKSMFIYALSLIFSELTIFVLFFEVLWVVAWNLIRKF